MPKNGINGNVQMVFGTIYHKIFYYVCLLYMSIRYTFTRASIAPFQINASILAWSMPIVQCTFIYIHTVATFAGFSVSLIAFTHVSSRFIGTYLITPSIVFQAFVYV